MDNNFLFFLNEVQIKDKLSNSFFYGIIKR